MQQLRILLRNYPKHPKNYGILCEPNWERMVWEKMAEQIKAPLRYLKHFIESEWVDTSDKDGMHICTDDNSVFKQQVDDLKIPLGTLSYYVIVYVEDMESNTLQ